MDVEAALLEPPHLYSRSDVLSKPSPVPNAAGVYAWYFDEPPPQVPTAGTHRSGGHFLLYVGIAPRKPASSGEVSKRTLRDRLRQHYALNAYGSTLRLTLGCLLGLPLPRIESAKNPGSAKRMTLGPDEERLSGWMEDHARVVWMTHLEPWEVEDRLLDRLKPPLNLRGNEGHAFYPALTKLRAECREQASSVPPLPSTPAPTA
jgi:hypothetical protein